MKGVVATVKQFARRPTAGDGLAEDQLAVDSLAVLGALPVPVVLLNQKDEFRYANQAAEQFFGMSRLQLAHMTLRTVLPLS